ncbi:MAG: hypothetical protein KDH97_24300, partial [Calditrichaeota bacterium]|nr:hypothetical protein [Calditrichota bacterium]
MNELAFGGKPAKIYTAGIISVATYFGGPLAAGYLISRNFKVFGKEDHARNAFYLGILATILLIGFFLMVPERYIEIIPRSLFPMTYTGLVYWIVY